MFSISKSAGFFHKCKIKILGFLNAINGVNRWELKIKYRLYI